MGYANHNNIEVKKYVQINVLNLLDTRTPEGKELWSEIRGHGCFTGNDSMMVFERFWAEGCSYEELLEHNEDPNRFEVYLTKVLMENGYIYKNYKLYDTEGNSYDGVLLDISW